MDGALYMLSRQIKGDEGEPLMQNVAVFATSSRQARALVEQQFARLRLVSKGQELAYQTNPIFSVEKIELDAYKVVTVGVTR